MSLLAYDIRPASETTEAASFVGRFWRAHRQRKAARASLKRLLDRSDDHLLDDVGIDRETALRLLGDASGVRPRDWRLWQLG